MEDTMSALIVWNEDLSVNVRKIDEQHHKLVDLINELYEAMQKGQSKEFLDEIIDGLIDYSVIHFNTEEGLLEKFSYPNLEIHKEEHSLFKQKVTKFQNDYKKGTAWLSIDMLLFLSDWLKTHIKKSDKSFSKFLNEKGMF